MHAWAAPCPHTACRRPRCLLHRHPPGAWRGPWPQARACGCHPSLEPQQTTAGAAGTAGADLARGTVLGPKLARVVGADAADELLELARLLVPGGRVEGWRGGEEGRLACARSAAPAAGRRLRVRQRGRHPARAAPSSRHHATQQGGSSSAHFSRSLWLFHEELAARKTYLQGRAGRGGAGWGGVALWQGARGEQGRPSRVAGGRAAAAAARACAQPSTHAALALACCSAHLRSLAFTGSRSCDSSNRQSSPNVYSLAFTGCPEDCQAITPRLENASAAPPRPSLVLLGVHWLPSLIIDQPNNQACPRSLVLLGVHRLPSLIIDQPNNQACPRSLVLLGVHRVAPEGQPGDRLVVPHLLPLLACAAAAAAGWAAGWAAAGAAAGAGRSRRGAAASGAGRRRGGAQAGRRQARVAPCRCGRQAHPARPAGSRPPRQRHQQAAGTLMEARKAREARAPGNGCSGTGTPSPMLIVTSRG